MIAAGEAFFVRGHLEAPGCADWGAVDAGAWACLDGTRPADAEPLPLPRQLFGDLPYVYGRRSAARPGWLYASAEAFAAGAGPVGRLAVDDAYHFHRIEPTARGEVAVRDSGRVVPLAQLRSYEISSFAGRDLREDPVPAGAIAGWCVARAGCGELAYQQAFTLHPPERIPAGATVWTLPPALGLQERWIDLDLGRQLLTLMQGAEAEFATLVSTGLGGRHQTPRGSFRLSDKLLANDMVSLPDAPERYSVEQVPWVMHFLPRYALHGAFWHDRFGHRRSHGCVNLSPADARRIFGLVRPELPPGWRGVWASEADPGTLLRIR